MRKQVLRIGITKKLPLNNKERRFREANTHRVFQRQEKQKKNYLESLSKCRVKQYHKEWF